MPLAGFLVAEGRLSLAGIIVAGTVGSVLGALPLYYLGNRLGEKRLRRFAARHGRWLTLSPADINRANRWFDRHGAKAVFFCRLIPGIRSIISIPAGVNRMKLPAFLFFTTLGSSLWTTALASAGYVLGSNFHEIERYFDPFTYIVFGAIIALYLWRVFSKEKSETGEAV
jgi:membrane protein DedA with SNARE-associated domain